MTPASQKMPAEVAEQLGSRSASADRLAAGSAGRSPVRKATTPFEPHVLSLSELALFGAQTLRCPLLCSRGRVYPRLVRAIGQRLTGDEKDHPVNPHATL